MKNRVRHSHFALSSRRNVFSNKILPIQLRPTIEKSKYHRLDQQGVEVTIPIEGDISSREKETMAWDMLVTVIHSAARASLPGNKWKKNVTREIQAKVTSL
jgi:hypothetical protein